MRFLGCLALLIASVLPAYAVPQTKYERMMSSRGLYANNVDGVDAQYFDQVLDHFDPSNSVTFKQKYYVNNSVFKDNGPIFIQLGGEGPISPGYVSGGLIMNDFAQEHGALIVGIEHRFYGESIPGDDTSVSNLKYLSSHQALADLTTFIQHLFIQYNMGNATPVITFGGSYSGALSAWARSSYPFLIKGSLAASAPIKALLDFSEYLQIVSHSLGSTCSNKLSSGFNSLQPYLSSADGLAQLHTMFNTCSPLSGPKDISLFFELITDSIASVVQYNNEGGITIDSFCSTALSQSDDLKSILAVKQLLLPSGCMDTNYSNYVASFQPTSSMRSWTYQTCTEFGFYQTAEDSNLQPFAPQVDLAFFVDLCKDLFGLTGVQANIDRTNLLYGSTNIVTSNTVFTNGNVDPWHALGLTNSNQGPGLGPDTFVFYLNGTAHCADMYSPRSDDPIDITTAHSIQRSYISKWLSQ